MAMNAMCSDVSGVVAMGVRQVRELTASSLGGTTEFAKALLSLLEVTGQLAELDDNSQLAVAGPQGGSDEACKWREISSKTMQFAKETLVGQQLHALEVLQDLSARGGSLLREPGQEKSQEVATAKKEPKKEPPCSELINVDSYDFSTSCGESSGSDGEDSCKAGETGSSKKPLQAPPGLSAPPGLCAPPPGLSALAGMEQISTCSAAKKAAPWRSTTVVAKQVAKKVAPWRSSKAEAASADKKAVGVFQ